MWQTQSKNALLQKLPTVLLMALVAALFLATHLHFRSPVLPYDDAFIAFRYIDNFTHAQGLVYNAGERAWGFSTVTYIFWLSAWHWLLPHVPLPELAVRTNVIPFLAVGVGVFLLFLRYSGSRLLAVVTACLVVLNAGLLGVSTGGMESFLFVALVLFTLLAAPAHPRTAGLLAGLAFLTRVEGIVLAPILLLFFLRQPKALVKMSAAMLSLPLVWIGFASSYYGTFIPHSIIAKNRPLYALEPLSAVMEILNHLSGAFSLPGTLVILFPLCICTIGCLIYRPFRARGAWSIPVFFWGIFVMYAYGNPLFFEWYWPSFLVPAIMTIALGFAAISTSIADPERKRERPAGALIPASWAVWMLFAALAGWRFPLRGDRNPNWPVAHTDSEPSRLRCGSYRKAAEWVNAHRRPGETVLAPEIGALGYYLNGSLIDACGLVSPEAIQYLPVPPHERLNGRIGSIPLGLVRDRQPDFIVTMPVFAEKNVLNDPWAKQQYYLVSEFKLPLPTYGSDRVLVLKHGPPATPASGQ